MNDRLKKDKAALARIDAKEKTADKIRIGPDRGSIENKKDSQLGLSCLFESKMSNSKMENKENKYRSQGGGDSQS